VQHLISPLSAGLSPLGRACDTRYTAKPAVVASYRSVHRHAACIVIMTSHIASISPCGDLPAARPGLAVCRCSAGLGPSETSSFDAWDLHVSALDNPMAVACITPFLCCATASPCVLRLVSCVLYLVVQSSTTALSLICLGYCIVLLPCLVSFPALLCLITINYGCLFVCHALTKLPLLRPPTIYPVNRKLLNLVTLDNDFACRSFVVRIELSL
jgi:hypothetical protein